MATERVPAEVFPPGEFLKDMLEARGWTQADLAEIIGRHPTTVNEIIGGKSGISHDMAQVLAAAFGTSWQLWINLDAAHQAHKLRNEKNAIRDARIAHRAKVIGKGPVKEMIRRGWIEPSDNYEVLEARVCRFFEIERIEDEPESPLHAAKKSTAYDQPTSTAQIAWLRRALQLARAVPAAKPFSKQGLEEAVKKLRLLPHAPQEARHVPRILSEAGIKFVIVQPLAGSRIDGACLWDGGAPIVAMSLRFDRIDNFWFVLFHELDHVRKREPSLDDDIQSRVGDATLPAPEQAANEYASETLIPARQIESFAARVGPFYSAKKIEGFAYTMQVHPAIVVGQLQHRGEVAYSNFRKLMAPIREWVTPSAVTDGWGAALPAQL